MIGSAQKISHKEWRKAAKKYRRQRIRQRLAEVRKYQEKLKKSSPTYLLTIEKKRLFEEYELEKEKQEREVRQLNWLEEEERAQKKWREEQKLKELALEEKLKEQERIRKEWEKEQEKFRKQKERLEALKKEEEERRQEILDRINDFICNGGDVPLELQAVSETNPGKDICSFFQKVGSCRFGSQCSRNHQHLKISNVLMFANFYSHFTLDQNKTSEYDTDISLEYEDSDMYSHFKEFYNDIVPEFKRFGEVKMVRVCYNTEPHLRGNVYVQYANEREALVAYKGFQGRWYGGKQLNVEFVKIKDWGGAVCGDFARRRCPKGKLCNFLHVFRNPKNEFPLNWNRQKSNSSNFVKESFDDCNKRHSRSRSWRWSETPEPSFKKSRRNSSKERCVISEGNKSTDKASASLSAEKCTNSDDNNKSHKRKKKSLSKDKFSKTKKEVHKNNH